MRFDLIKVRVGTRLHGVASFRFEGVDATKLGVLVQLLSLAAQFAHVRSSLRNAATEFFDRNDVFCHVMCIGSPIL